MLQGLLLSLAIWTGPVDDVWTLEFNTFGDQPRTSILYRDFDGSIVDWRWYAKPDQIPVLVRPGLYVAVWNDQGKPRAVYCREVRYTRTREDRELQDRDRLPEHRRRKLSR